ncbi:hypothetical protein BST61_g1112 [Cercospora zeina]
MLSLMWKLKPQPGYAHGQYSLQFTAVAQPLALQMTLVCHRFEAQTAEAHWVPLDATIPAAARRARVFQDSHMAAPDPDFQQASLMSRIPEHRAQPPNGTSLYHALTAAIDKPYYVSAVANFGMPKRKANRVRFYNAADHISPLETPTQFLEREAEHPNVWSPTQLDDLADRHDWHDQGDDLQYKPPTQKWVDYPLALFYAHIPDDKWPTGQDRGIMTRVFDFCKINGLTDATTSQWEKLVKDLPAEPEVTPLDPLKNLDQEAVPTFSLRG